MPPKGKKAAQEAEDIASASATRGTRSSARQKDASTIVEKPSGASTKKRKAVSDGQEEKKTTKRAKKTKTAATSAKDDDDGADGGAGSGKSKAAAKSKGAAASPVASVTSPGELFDAYAEADDPQTMGAEGLERLCGDANISMDGALPLLLAWQLDAKELGTFSRDEWTKGLDELQIRSLDSLVTSLVDLEDLIILRKPPPAKPVTQSISKGIKSKSAPPAIDKYKKDRYWGYAANVDVAFLTFYGFCFALVKREGSRNIDMEYACAFWSVILAPSYPIVSEIIEFINEKGTYRGVNKDLWSMVDEFCRTVKPSLEGYDSEGAWPTLLDDFVEWKKAKMDASAGDASS